jgi:hypothetical protein
MDRRVLSDGEAAILAMIQQGYGPQNSANNVFFTSAGEAILSIRTVDGTSPLMANLSNLATWRANGTITSDDELKRDWLRLKA